MLSSLCPLQEVNLRVEFSSNSNECEDVRLVLVRTPSSPNFKNFFMKMSYRPRFVVFSALGEPIDNRFSEDETVVVARNTPTPMYGEVEHMVQWWKMSNEMSCSKVCRLSF